MSARVYVGTRRVDAVPAQDRGFAYGDGLFETMRLHGGEVPWWDAHWRRLTRGAEQLRLMLPAGREVLVAVRELLQEGAGAHSNGVLKLIVTRGNGGRGYAPPADGEPTWALSIHPLPVSTPGDGLTLRWCETRLAIQPALAGLKHCNRLEQVLARAEWDVDEVADEGLMRSSEGDVVCATAGNVFALVDGRWRTPRVDRCGVAGVCREHLLVLADAVEERITVNVIEAAQALVLCNAVRGILPVARLGERTWSPHPRVAELQRRLAAGHPAFSDCGPAAEES